MDLVSFFSAAVTGDLASIKDTLAEHPYLITARNPNSEAWDEQSVLHAAAKHGYLDLVEHLVDAGAEVYSNPTSSYPPVIIAAWNSQQDVVDYFLQKIPDKASGTGGLGVTVNLAAREGWIDPESAQLQQTHALQALH